MTEIYEVSAPQARADELVKWLAGKGQAADLLSAAAAKQDYATIIARVLEDSASLLKAVNDEELEGAFTLILSLLANVPLSDRATLVNKIADVLGGGSDGKGVLTRLRILVSLYNGLQQKTEQQAKLSVLKKIISFATEAKQLDLIAPYLQSISKWNLDQPEAATLYYTISTSYQKLGQTEEEQQFLIKYLTTFEGASAEAMAAITHAARSAAINYLKAAAGSQKYDVPRLQAVKALSNHPQHARLYDLVDIFAHRDLAELTAWLAADGNAGYLAEQGLDAAKATETMRLLTLCSLASKSKVLSYEAIAQALQVKEDAVESWVVRAITTGLIDARMDQQAQTVIVSRSTERVFDAAAWKNLHTTLTNFRQTVSTLLSVGSGNIRSAQ